MPKAENNKNIFIETLEWICHKLELAGIPYMITGGSAVGFWGHIRTTIDIDILIQIYSEQISPFLKSIENEAYVAIEEARVAILNKSIFNIILNSTSFKVDIIPLDTKNDYEREKFERRIKVKFQNNEIYIIAPEDLIISKLIWSKSAGGSERQLKDCESIYRLNSENLNLNYINKWVEALNIKDEFSKLTL